VFILLFQINSRIFKDLNTNNVKPLKNRKINFRNIGPKIIEEDEDYEEDYEI
jgi:hypothetical protein